MSVRQALNIPFQRERDIAGKVGKPRHPAKPDAASPPATADDGVGISAWRIQRLADGYQDFAHARAQQTGGDICPAECDAWLRQRLAYWGVLPEFVEVEAERVMAEVFRV